MNRLILEVEAEVNPTEDPEKVMTAVRRMFGDMKLEMTQEGDKSLLTGRAEGLDSLRSFHDLLRREMILDAARGVMFKGLQGNTITFYLNKQVAYVGHVSFSQPEKESPLGPIRVRIECDNPRRLIDWLTPRTR